MTNNKLNIIFIGGLTNGKIVFDYLLKNRYVNLCLAITFPDNYRGARHIPFENHNFLIKSGTLKGYEDQILNLKPDMIIVAGWSELIPDNILKLPTYGVIGFHPSKLPFDRGRSVIAWQIEDGYEETALTMFKYSTYPDGGDILAQEKVIIEKNDYVSDILDKVDKATKNLMYAYFPLLRQGLLQPCPQNLTEGSFRRLRNEEDSQINWNNNSQTIYNKIRAISHPYPGAIAMIQDKKIRVWKAEIIDSFFMDCSLVTPGTLVASCFDNTLVVKTKDSFIRITHYTWQ